MSVPWKRSLAESTSTWRLQDETTSELRSTKWIPRQVTASTPGEGVESIPGGKPASNWR